MSAFPRPFTILGAPLGGTSYFGDGAVGSPSITFLNDSDTGFYRSGSGTIAVAANGVNTVTFGTTGVRVADGTAAAPSIAFLSDPTTGFSRFAAGVLQLSGGGTARLFISGNANPYIQGLGGSYILFADVGYVGLYASGTNQSIYLNPSGSGYVYQQWNIASAGANILQNQNAAGYAQQIIRAYNGSGWNTLELSAVGWADILEIKAYGSMVISANGTNKNITLTPSGTGKVNTTLINATATGANNMGLQIYNTNATNTIGLTMGDTGLLLVRDFTAAANLAAFVPTSGTFLLGTTTDSSNGRLQLATHTTSAGGIGFGTDTAFFRAGAGNLVICDVSSTNAALSFYNGTTTQRASLYANGGLTKFIVGSTSSGWSTVLQSAGADVITLDSAQNATFAKFIQHGGSTRTTADFTKTSDTTLANITGLSVSVAAAGVYRFRAVLHLSCNASGGSKVAIAGTATATAIRYTAFATTATAVVSSTANALGTAVAAATAANVLCEIEGWITVNVAGTLTVQFAQNASFGTGSTVLTGSTFEVELTP